MPSTVSQSYSATPLALSSFRTKVVGADRLGPGASLLIVGGLSAGLWILIAKAAQAVFAVL